MDFLIVYTAHLSSFYGFVCKDHVIILCVYENYFIFHRFPFYFDSRRQSRHFVQQHQECLLSAVWRRNGHPVTLPSQGQFVWCQGYIGNGHPVTLPSQGQFVRCQGYIGNGHPVTVPSQGQFVRCLGYIGNGHPATLPSQGQFVRCQGYIGNGHPVTLSSQGQFVWCQGHWSYACEDAWAVIVAVMFSPNAALFEYTNI
jgi:hypothetical protein